MERKSPDLNMNMLNERGNILIICMVIIIILTSLGLYALNSTTVELNMAGRDKQDSINLQKAESGLIFVKANFDQIYKNDNGAATNSTLYTTNPITRSNPTNGPGLGGIISFTMANGFIRLTATNTPPGTPVALRDMEVDTAGVAFQYNNLVNNVSIPVSLIEIRAIMRNNTTNPNANDIIISNPQPGTIAENFSLFTPYGNSIPDKPHIGFPPKNSGDTVEGRTFMITSTPLSNDGTISGAPVQCIVVVGAIIPEKDELRLK